MTKSRMNCIRAGFMRCSRANSPVSDHHSADSRVKCEISSALMVVKLDAAPVFAEGPLVPALGAVELEVPCARMLPPDHKVGWGELPIAIDRGVP